MRLVVKQNFCPDDGNKDCGFTPRPSAILRDFDR